MSDDADAAARALEELAATRRQRHAFLAGLAHDLRNPLAPLSNGLELLRLTDADPAGRQRTRGIMERQVANLMRIADALSELARLTGENATLQSSDFALGDLTRQVEQGARAALATRDMRLEVALDAAAASTSLRGDSARLAEGLRHALDDLARHSEPGSTLRLSASAGADKAVLVIEPILDDDPPPLLEEAEAGAFGLGVALCEQIVALHHGRLRVQRPPGGRRARYTATLPLSEPATQDAARSPTTGQEASGSTTSVTESSPAPLAALVADDNTDFARSFATMLELLGHRVTVVHDGLQALRAMEQAPPDIAFIDIGMPTLDGFATVQRARGLDQLASVMLVAVTGRGAAEDRARAAESGFDRYLVKPFSMQDVRDALDVAQQRRAGTRDIARGRFAPGGRAS